ncbi:MAG: gliding motility-associated C-terminal domain-containing protein [Bacteroidota bacterium]|nr:gliding motility-associated C-terminal domain-containing protein [Bacteroidota bacterium]
MSSFLVKFMPDMKLLGIIIFSIFLYDLTAQCNLTVDAGPDVIVCSPGDVATLNGRVTGQATEIFWDPITGLSNPRSPVTNVTVTGPQTYTLVARGVSNQNLVTNGDFEAGRSGFTTSYAVGSIPCYGLGYLDCEGTYDVINNPMLGHASWAPCGDHTSGSGNMMVVNGAATFQDVWCQTISVIPNMDYILTAWVTSVSPASPAILQFSANGNTVGGLFYASGATCRWERFQATWNSGGSTSVTICILNQNTATGGNDFALDDISLRKICEVKDEVNVDILDIQAVIENPDIVTCDKPIIQLSGIGSSTGPNWTYKWTTNGGKIISGANTLTPTVEGPGFYIFEVCSSVPVCCKSITIQVTGNIIPPLVFLSTKDTLGCGKNVAVIRTRTNSPFRVDYEWSGPNGYSSTDQDAAVFDAGLYTVKVTDEFNCITIDTIRVFEKNDNPKVSIIGNAINCTLDSTYLKAMSSVTGSSFTWTGPKGNKNQGDSWVNVDTGWYFIQIKTPSGCIVSDSILIKADQRKPDIQINKTDINCVQDTAFIQANSKRTITKALWIGPNQFTSDSLFFNTVYAGWYYLQLEATNGCTQNDSVLIQIDTLKPIISISGDTLNCITPTITLLSFGNDTADVFNWVGPGAFISSEQNPIVSESGWYTVEVLSKNGCKDSAGIYVDTDFALVTLDPSTDTLNCFLDSVIIQANPNQIYQNIQWSGPNGFTSLLENPTTKISGWHLVSITGKNGCINQDSIFVNADYEKPEISIQTDTLTCSSPIGKFNTLIIKGNPQFHWIGPGNFNSYEIDPDINTAGIYTVRITNPNGCYTDTLFQFAENKSKPIISSNNDTLTCAKDSIQLRLQISSVLKNLNWTGPNNFNSSELFPFIKIPGDYIAIAEGANGCVDSIRVTVFQDIRKPELEVDLDTLNCVKRIIDLVAKTNRDSLLYLWTGSQGFISDQKQIQIQNGGNYTVSVSSPEGCKSSYSFFISEDTIKPTIVLLGDSLNCQKTNGLIQLTSNLPIVEYAWSGPGLFTSSNPNAIITQGGNYFIRIKSTNHCENIASITIIQDTIKPIFQVVTDTITCLKPEVTLIANSPNLDLSYRWSTPKGNTLNTQSINTRDAGLYKIQVVAKNHCSNELDVLVAVDTIQPVVLVSDDTINCINIFADLLSTSSHPNLIYSWTGPNNYTSNKATDQTFISGKYFLIARALNGCQTYKELLISIDTTKPFFTLLADSIDCIHPTASISINGQTNGLDILWTDPLGKQFTQINSLKTTYGGLFDVEVKNPKNGCFTRQSKFVIEDSLLIHDLSLFTVDPKCGLKVGSVNVVQVLGGHGGFEYSLDLGKNYTKNTTFSNLTATTYTLTVRDQKDCLFQKDFEIVEQPFVTTDLIPELELRLGQQGIIDLNVHLDNNLIQSILWSPADGLSCTTCEDPVVNILESRYYNVTVIDTNGCMATERIFIRIEEPKVYAPNVFSPNKDNVNDNFLIFGPEEEILKINYLQIYDRWGERVFQNENFLPNKIESGWDGRFKDRDCSPGVYVYVAEVELINGKKWVLKGDVTLLK